MFCSVDDCRGGHDNDDDDDDVVVAADPNVKNVGDRVQV